MVDLKTLLPIPCKARHAEYSMIFSADDEVSKPSKWLIDIALKAIPAASNISLNDISARMKSGPDYPAVWPGEHYRLLAGLVQCLTPDTVIEIGTSSGLSALTLKKFLPPGGQVITFDLIPWQSFPDSVLCQADFEDEKLVQKVEDLRDARVMLKNKEVLERAKIIFIDAAKDGSGEYAFVNNLRNLNFKEVPLVVFDDIRLWNMLKFWREITAPKLDLTSFGHWSGTGLVEWRW